MAHQTSHYYDWIIMSVSNGIIIKMSEGNNLTGFNELKYESSRNL